MEPNPDFTPKILKTVFMSGVDRYSVDRVEDLQKCADVIHEHRPIARGRQRPKKEPARSLVENQESSEMCHWTWPSKALPMLDAIDF